jgi:hypothetical protein
VKRVSITEARRICEQIGARGVIVLSFDEDDVQGTSYGATREECADLAETLEAIAEKIEREEILVWSFKGIIARQRQKHYTGTRPNEL